MKKSIVSVLALVAAMPAAAQVVPTGRSTDDAGNEIVVTASRSGDGVAANLVGASVTVLDTQAVEARQTRIVSDILRDVPGFAVSRTGAVGGLTQVRVRGAEGNHVLVLIDGIEAADPYYGEYDFGTLIAEQGVRIEALRGQQSSLYGSDAIAGVVHYITQSGAEAPGIQLRGEGGSDGTYNGAARVAGVAGTLDYALSGTYFHTDGYPTSRAGTRNVGSEQYVLSGKTTWTPGPGFALTAVGRYAHTDADTNDQSFANGPTLGQVVDSPDTGFKNRAAYGLLSGRFTSTDDSFTAALTAQIADFHRRGRSLGVPNADTKGQRLKGSFDTSYRIVSGDVQHRFTVAADVEREKFQNVLGSFGAFSGQLETDNLGLVGQYELLVADRLSLSGSVRHDRNDRFADPTTFRVQGSYRLPTGTRLRAAYGTGVKNPSYFELFGSTDRYIGNPGLKPEKSEGWEVGVEQSFADGRGVIGATYFDSELRDEIFTVFGNPRTSDNRTTKSKQKGVEAFLTARPVPQIRVDASYTYLDAEENGVVEIRRPKHIASLNTTVLSPDERLSGTLTVRYNGRQIDTAFDVPPFGGSRRVELQEYVLVNLNAVYRLTDSLELFGRVENLADEDYEEVFAFATPGRRAYGGVRVRF